MKRALAALVIILTAGVVAAERPVGLSILDEGYPRALFFRRAEGIAASGNATFEEWDATFSRLNGVIGKCLDEEVLGRSKNVDFFRRFKQAHPEQLLLVHLNGNCRDTSFGVERYFAGHWLYFQGCGLARDLASDESTIHVDDASLFMTEIFKRKNRNDDIALCRLDADGKSDWSAVEHVRLVSIDARANTLKVERGLYGSKAMAFVAGKTYAAPHATVPPPAEMGNMRWVYNLASTCPRDAKGKTAGEVFAEEIGEWFSPGGPCDLLDGVAFDVSFFYPRVPRNNFRQIDADADGLADNGVIGSVQEYGLGVNDFYVALRKTLGPDRLITADGQDSGNQRAFGLMNGMESEGFPVHRDQQIVDWSGAINRQLFWRDRGAEPRFNYILHKYQEGKRGAWQPPYNITRLVLAATMMTDSVSVVGIMPPIEGEELHGVWDELRAGVEWKPNWLGKPAGATKRLAKLSPDLLKGRSIARDPMSWPRWTSESLGVSTRREGEKLIVSRGGDDPSKIPPPMVVTFNGPALEAGDVTVCLTLSADADHATGDAPRLIQATFASRRPGEEAPKNAKKTKAAPGKAFDPETFHSTPVMTLVDGTPFEAAFCFRGVAEGPFALTFEIEGGAPVYILNLTVHNTTDAMAREFEHGVVVVNPSLEAKVFGMAELFPGAKLRRIKGSPDQDPKTNNGEPVGKMLTLEGRDAIFLKKD